MHGRRKMQKKKKTHDNRYLASSRPGSLSPASSPSCAAPPPSDGSAASCSYHPMAGAANCASPAQACRRAFLRLKHLHPVSLFFDLPRHGLGSSSDLPPPDLTPSPPGSLPPHEVCAAWSLAPSLLLPHGNPRWTRPSGATAAGPGGERASAG